MEDLENLMSRLIKEGADRIILNSGDIEELMRKGVKFDKTPEKSPEEYIDLLFAKRKENAISLLRNLPTLSSIAAPTIRALYTEIRECIIFGLNGAAITLSGILVEYVLKYTTIVWEEGSHKYNPDKMDEFEKMTFNFAIDRAESAGLLTSEEKDKLTDFKNTIRNPYNHYNIKKITQDVIWPKVKKLNFKTLKIEEKDIAAKDDLVIQAQAKPFVDAYKVLEVFKFADNIINMLFNKMDDMQQKGK